MKSIFQRPIIIHRRIAWLLLFFVVTLALAGWIIYLGIGNIEKSNARINQTYEITATLRDMLNELAESGEVPAAYIDSLQKFTRDNHDLQPQIQLLAAYINNKKPSADIRLLLRNMLQQEKQVQTKRKQINEQANRHTAYLLILGRVAAFVFVALILLLLNRDITRHKATQKKLFIAMEEAQMAKKMQEQFLANMSHEIRTPMNGIKGMTDLLLGSPLQPKQQEMAGMIKRSVNNLLVIINDILDFSKIQAGKLRIEKIDLSVQEVVNNVVLLFEHQLQMKGLQFQLNIDPAIPEQLTGDPYRLNQVLTNLLGNALKFTSQGRILLTISLQQKLTDGVIISFTITDTGIGIPEDSLPYIFDNFSQASQDITRRYGGTGLGLAICKQLVQLLGGDISVNSTVGKGTSFEFYLPFGFSSKPVAEQAESDTPRDHSQLLAGKRILVAEDNEINQRLIELVLLNAGADVTMTGNGAEAVGFLKEGNEYDLIIMDLQMPEMDGYTATRYIRNNLHLQTPIIAMTATAMKDEQWQCFESGMNDYMTKPFEFADLYKRIGYLMH